MLTSVQAAHVKTKELASICRMVIVATALMIILDRTALSAEVSGKNIDPPPPPLIYIKSCFGHSFLTLQHIGIHEIYIRLNHKKKFCNLKYIVQLVQNIIFFRSFVADCDAPTSSSRHKERRVCIVYDSKVLYNRQIQTCPCVRTRTCTFRRCYKTKLGIQRCSYDVHH